MLLQALTGRCPHVPQPTQDRQYDKKINGKKTVLPGHTWHVPGFFYYIAQWITYYHGRKCKIGNSMREKQQKSCQEISHLRQQVLFQPSKRAFHEEKNAAQQRTRQEGPENHIDAHSMKI